MERAERYGERWTDKEIKRLKKAHKKGGVVAACKAFEGERTCKSVREKIARLRLMYLSYWTDEEDIALVKMWTKGVARKEIAAKLDRTSMAVSNRVRVLGLSGRRKFVPWTREEMRVIGAEFERIGPARVSEKLSKLGHERTPNAVSKKAGSMGLSFSWPDWSEEEDGKLRRMWRDGVPVAIIAQRLGRTRKGVACRRAYLEIAPRGTGWAEWEIIALRKFYPEGGSGVVVDALGGKRSADSVRSKAMKLGVRYEIDALKARVKRLEDKGESWT